MVAKKGFIHILEATISIMIILSVLLLVIIKTSEPTSEELGRFIPRALEEIARNTDYRIMILSCADGSVGNPCGSDGGPECCSSVENNETINQVITDVIPEGIKYKLKICAPDSACAMSNFPKCGDDYCEVFANSRLISAEVSVEGAEMKRIKLFLWRES